MHMHTQCPSAWYAFASKGGVGSPVHRAEGNGQNTLRWAILRYGRESHKVNSIATQPASAAAGSEVQGREEGEKRLFPELLDGHAHSC